MEGTKGKMAKGTETTSASRHQPHHLFAFIAPLARRSTTKAARHTPPVTYSSFGPALRPTPEFRVLHSEFRIAPSCTRLRQIAPDCRGEGEPVFQFRVPSSTLRVISFIRVHPRPRVAPKSDEGGSTLNSTLSTHCAPTRSKRIQAAPPSIPPSTADFGLNTQLSTIDQNF